MTLRQALALAIAVPLLTVAGARCKGEPQRAAELARAEERLNLVSNPTLYLQAFAQERRDDADVAGDVTISEKRIVSITVRNTSHFAVEDIDGAILWLDESEHRIGATPFVLHEPLAPDQLKRFLVADTADAGAEGGTPSARAASLRIVFDHVHAIE